MVNLVKVVHVHSTTIFKKKKKNSVRDAAVSLKELQACIWVAPDMENMDDIQVAWHPGCRDQEFSASWQGEVYVTQGQGLGSGSEHPSLPVSNVGAIPLP